MRLLLSIQLTVFIVCAAWVNTVFASDSGLVANISPWFVEYSFPAGGHCEGDWTYEYTNSKGEMVFRTDMWCASRSRRLNNRMTVVKNGYDVHASGNLNGDFRHITGFCEFNGRIYGDRIRGGSYHCNGNTREQNGWQAENVNF